MLNNYQESRVIGLIGTILKEGFQQNLGIDIDVEQKYQPEIVGMPERPTIYIHKISADNYGFVGSNSTNGVVESNQWKTPTYQVNVLALQNTEESYPMTATDYAEAAAAILNLPSAINVLRSNEIGIDRITNIREMFFTDDRVLFEQQPSFDFTLSYQRTYSSTVNTIGIDDINGEDVPLND